VLLPLTVMQSAALAAVVAGIFGGCAGILSAWWRSAGWGHGQQQGNATFVNVGSRSDGAAPNRRTLALAIGVAALGCVLLGLRLPADALLLAGLLLAVPAVGLGAVELLRLNTDFRALRLAMRGAYDGLWWWNPVSKELRVGDRLLAILGYSENFLTSTDEWLKLVHPDDRARYNELVGRHLKGLTPYFQMEYRVRAKDGGYRWLAARGVAVRDRRGVARLMSGSVSDVTERKEAEQQIRYLAFHDQLTGLANRALLRDRLEQAILHAKRDPGESVAVLFVDVDRFKDVNDAYGHELGDRMLVELARRFKGVMRESDTLVRQGGDEFIVVLPVCGDELRALRVAEALLEAARRPFKTGGIELCASASIGVSVYPKDAGDGESLLKNADTAMYCAKYGGGNAVRFYRAEMNEAVRRRVSIETGLRQAIARNQLALHFQPQMSIADGALIGCEALLRWRDGSGENVPPDQFIPVAETSGLILPIGEWVVERAIGRIREWRAAGLAVPRVAVNVSARQIVEAGFAQRLLARLAAADIEPEAFEVEVTESIFMRQDSEALAELERLRSAGVRIALDDFGTGYSSLSYLSQLPFDRLKIDRGFVLHADAPDAARSAALLRAMVGMASAYGMEVLAEGVERRSQLDALQALGCNFYQGYVCSPPLPQGEFAMRFLGARPS